ncbi:MAG TPA: AMP-binding protein, partial [Mycobacterium sp.]
MTVIHKTAEDWRVVPNFTDYDKTRATFDWATAAPDLCAGMGDGGCNIAYAAVDRHADGPTASRTALRFVSAAVGDGAPATRDLSYAELARLARRFTNVLRAVGITKGDRVFTLMGRCPELYIT